MPSIFYEQRPERFFVGSICDHPFPTHVHDSVEIVCLTEGGLDMSVGGVRYSICPGDIAVTFPTVPHSYDFVSKDAQGLSIIFLPDAISEFSNTFRTKLPCTPVLTADKAPVEMDPIIRQMLKLSAQENNILLTGYLHLFLAYLFTRFELQPLTKRMQSELAHQILHYISQHFTEPLSQESVSRALGISGTYLSHIFSQQLHINFREYINALRIDHACSLLYDPSLSISQIVYLCGFGNPRTFHRAFLSRCQTTPNQYRIELLSRSAAGAVTRSLPSESSPQHS